LVALRKHNWLAAILGVLLTGGPVLWFTSWLQKQGETEVSITANGSIGITELILDEAVASLNELAGRGVDSCQASDVEVLRKTVFASGPIKELAVIGPNGQTLCTDNGSSFLDRDILVTAATPIPDIMLDVVRIAERNERMLRVRRLAPPGKPSLAALLGTNQFLPRVAPEGGPFSGHARMNLADGTLVGMSGLEVPESTLREDHIISRQRSERFGPIVTVAMVRNGVIANYDDLRRISMVVAGLVAFVILVCALVVPWRQRHNPILEIENALIAGEFVPFYQPIVDITSGRLLGAEVLVRWRKPDGMIIAPGAFIPLLESTGLILDLTRSLMRQVCKEVGPTIGLRPHMYIGFNIAPRHFRNSVILNDVGSIFEGSQIRLSQVVLELTERYEIENLGETHRSIAALQALGCKVALDDVGTGRNGLSYILKLCVDIIKIDKLFVDSIETEPHTQAIVRTLVDLASTLRMQIIAEGVEGFGQVTYLREHGISAAQGYVFAPPLPGSAFLRLVKAIDPLSAETAEDKLADAPQNIIVTFDRSAAA
jgi:sensor c-di-GMP phosphodiesterase-like protein